MPLTHHQRVIRMYSVTFFYVWFVNYPFRIILGCLDICYINLSVCSFQGTYGILSSDALTFVMRFIALRAISSRAVALYV